MFNLTNLITSCMLATGVATTTPVYHADNLPSTQAQNIVNNYSETLQQVNTTSQTYTGYDLNEWTYQYTETETKTNYAYNSNYINVLATKYQSTFSYTVNNEFCLGYGNEIIMNGQENKNYYERLTRSTFVFQLTPYNYNIDTETTIQLYSVINNYLDEYNDTIGFNDKYLYKSVYTTSQADWSEYLNRQIVQYQCNVLINEIEDVNNNFYYTKQNYKIELDNYGLTPYNDITELQLTPKKTNYVIIDEVIALNAFAYDPFNQEYESLQQKVIPMKTGMNGYGNITISGTNIIPDSTYEVIDIPGLMWEILTMPFSFVSQAFNLTLFPGTPYQVNISNLFLSIIAIIVFVWLISFFLKLKG